MPWLRTDSLLGPRPELPEPLGELPELPRLGLPPDPAEPIVRLEPLLPDPLPPDTLPEERGGGDGRAVSLLRGVLGGRLLVLGGGTDGCR